MFCRQCGHELRGDERFCTKCGAKIMDLAESENVSVREIESVAYGETAAGTKNNEAVEECLKDDATCGIMEYSRFDRIAIKFGDVLDIILGIVFLILALLLFSEGAVFFGVFFLVCGLLTVIGSVISLFSRTRKNEFTKEDLKKKKRNMMIAVVVFVIVIVIILL